MTVLVAPVRRDVVEVSGDDAPAFLHGQLSQDVADQPVGSTVWSLLLEPRGALVAIVRVTRTAAGRFVLDTDAGAGPAVVDALRRFLLRVDAAVEPLDWGCVAVRGADGAGLAPTTGTELALAPWPTVAGTDLLGPEPAAPTGAAPMAPAEWEAMRIRAGVPLADHELGDKVIPQEAGIVGPTVSFTKGCFTGQELVARLDSRGHVNRHLRLLAGADSPPPVGAEVQVAGESRGRLTSVAPVDGGFVALGFVRREVEAGDEVDVVDGDRRVTAVVSALPDPGTGPAR